MVYTGEASGDGFWTYDPSALVINDAMHACVVKNRLRLTRPDGKDYSIKICAPFATSSSQSKRRADDRDDRSPGATAIASEQPFAPGNSSRDRADRCANQKAFESWIVAPAAVAVDRGADEAASEEPSSGARRRTENDARH